MEPDQIKERKAVDIHSHFGEFNMTLGLAEAQKFMPAETGYLLKDMALANISISVNSHFKTMMPRGGGDAVSGNEICLAEVEKHDSLYMWVVIDPHVKESYAQAADMLKHPKCLGIKIHPEEHLYHISKFGDEIYGFAAKNNAVIITHSGEPNSMPEDFSIFANHFPDVKTIISHLGCGYDGDFYHQIRGVQLSTHGNMYTDTSSARSLFPNLLEIAISEIGAGKILFGTDSTCYFSPCQRARVDCAHICDDAKLDILYRNAVNMFPQLEGLCG